MKTKNRFEVQGPFHRNGVKPYWIVFDNVKKAVVSQTPRKGNALSQASTLENLYKEAGRQ